MASRDLSQEREGRLEWIRAYAAEDAAITDFPRAHRESPTGMVHDLLSFYDDAKALIADMVQAWNIENDDAWHGRSGLLARAAGLMGGRAHRFVDDPPARLSSVIRETCSRCGRSRLMVAGSRHWYGSAAHSSCPAAGLVDHRSAGG